MPDLETMEEHAVEMFTRPGYTSGQSYVEGGVFVTRNEHGFRYEYIESGCPSRAMTRQEAAAVLSGRARLRYGWHFVEGQ